MKIFFTNVGLKKFEIKKVLEKALKHLGQPSEKLEMSLSIVSPQEIQELNKQYRNVDAVTDVLSFPVAYVNKEVVNLSAFALDSINPETRRLNLGDVIICLDRAKQQAEEYGHSLKREICFLALHGLLHLLGYDHVEKDDEEQMTALQKAILQEVGVTRE